MFKKIIEKIKSFKPFIYTKDVEFAKYYFQFPLIDGSYILMDEEENKSLHYFCDDEGVKYGTETKNKNNLIIPKEIFIEAFNKYINN